MPVRMMDKGKFENARQYAKGKDGGTLSYWIGTDNNGAIVRHDHFNGRQTFHFFMNEFEAQCRFIALSE